MLDNLLNAMNSKHISTRAIAELIGTTEKTAYNKTMGVTDFTVPEALLVKDNLFPEYDFCYLFAKYEKERQEAV